METMFQDLRYGLRQLRKNLGFTAIAVLTLGLGIAVNATMFCFMSAFHLRHAKCSLTKGARGSHSRLFPQEKLA